MELAVETRLDGSRHSRDGEHSINLERTKKKDGRKKRNYRAFFSNLSQGCMVVVAILPIAGLFLGIGAAVVTAAKVNTPLYLFGVYLKSIGDFVFANLQILFAVSIAIAYTNQSAIAGFSAVAATFIFNGLQYALIIPNHIGLSQTVSSYDLLYWRHVPVSVFGTNAGILSLQSSVFGGIIVAAVVAVSYNKFHDIKLPDFLSFFSGTRFVPIFCCLVMLPVSLLMCIVWPGVGILFSIIGVGLGTLAGNGNANALIFGYIERSLVPFGVHHAFYSPLWYTQVGGDMNVNLNELAYIKVGEDQYAGVIGVEGHLAKGAQLTWRQIFEAILGKFNSDSLVGDQKIWMTVDSLSGHTLFLNDGSSYFITFKTFAQSTLNHPAAYIADNKLAFPGVDPGQYLQGKFPFMMFGLPAAGAAMIFAAPKQNRKFAFSIVGSSSLTSFLTGITEPIEFTFLFLSPLLYWGVHASLCAISFWLAALFGANVGETFSGSAIDFCIYGIMPDALGYKVDCWILALMGMVYAPVYFFIFYWWIRHFNLKTPGRGSTKLFTKKDYIASKTNTQVASNVPTFKDVDVQAYHVLEAIGGLKNLADVNACASKLRLTLNDDQPVSPNVVDLIKEVGAFGVEVRSHYIMAVFGGRSDLINTSIRRILDHKIDYDQLKTFVELGAGNEKQSDESISSNEAVSSDDVNQSLASLAIKAPLEGEVVDLTQTEDISFSTKTFGDGVAIIPTNGHVVSPIDGIVKVAFPTGHAYVISHDGIDIMIHIGIETVNINSKRKSDEPLVAFTPRVHVGDQVRVGDPIADVDLDYLRNNDYKTITPVIAVSESIGGYALKPIVSLGSNVHTGQVLFELVKKSQ